MPRYKLRPVEYGETVWLDTGDMCAVAETIEEARDLFAEHDDRPMYLHPAVAVHRIVYARDIEDGDCHDGAEPGDTTFTVRDGDPTHDSDRRVWMLGAPALCTWRMTPERRSVNPRDIPVGAVITHPRLGHGEMSGDAQAIDGRWWLPVRFADRERLCKASTIHILPTVRWAPESVYRLEIDGETVAEGDQWAMQTLLDIRESRLRSEWEAENFDPAALVPALEEDAR